MLAHQLSCAAMLLGFSIASPIARRSTNEVFNVTGSWNTSCPCGAGSPNWNSTGSEWNSTGAGYNSATAGWNSTWSDWNSTSLNWNSTGQGWNSTWSGWNSTSPSWNSAGQGWNNTGTWNSTAPSNCTGNTYSNNATDVYQFYQGDGSSADGWPSVFEWASLDDLWTANLPLITNSCTNLLTPPNNSPDENAAILASILSIASTTAVDARFILAIMIEESKGCVRVITTYGSVANPGLMQSHDGNNTCNVDGTVTIPCPDEDIYGMIEDGAGGTETGDGLAGLLDITAEMQGDGELAQVYYRAARMYNSGSIAADGNLGEGGSTHCYASDIANRLTGWVYAPSTCTLD